jgi:hypothetical protein
MFDVKAGELTLGDVTALTTNNTGLSPDYWADRCVEKIIYVAEGSDSILKDQAVAFKEAIRTAVRNHMKQAIKSDRTTLYNLFVQQGHTDMAEILRRL